MAEVKVLQQYNKCELENKKVGHGKRKGGRGFSNKCASLIKQQRARIYILRRCATMLLCWYIHGDE